MRRLLILSILVLMSGCHATHKLIHKRNLEVQTKMSASLFLDPAPSDQRTVFLHIRNTSDQEALDLTHPILALMQAKGYEVVTQPEQAHYLLQANVLQVGRSDRRASVTALNRGFGAAVRGSASGAAVGRLTTCKKTGVPVAAGRLVGAAVSTVADALVDDVFYSVIVDVQISERVGSSTVVKEKTRARLKQGTRGFCEITATQKVEWKRYQTRVVSTANQVNLNFKKAAPLLVQGLARSITGIF